MPKIEIEIRARNAKGAARAEDRICGCGASERAHCPNLVHAGKVACTLNHHPFVLRPSYRAQHSDY